MLTGEDDILCKVIFSYEAIIQDPFSDNSESEKMGFQKVYMSMTIYSADCIELDPEREKMKSTRYYKVKD